MKNEAALLAALLATTGALTLTIARWWMHPILGMLAFGMFCLIGAGFAARVAGL